MNIDGYLLYTIVNSAGSLSFYAHHTIGLLYVWT